MNDGYLPYNALGLLWPRPHVWVLPGQVQRYAVSPPRAMVDTVRRLNRFVALATLAIELHLRTQSEIDCYGVGGAIGVARA